MTVIELFLSGLVLAVLMMTCAWMLASKLNFFSLVDVAWAYGIGLIVLFYCGVGNGDLTRRVLAAGMASLWSLRLGTYLWIRLKEKFPEEDRRYLKIREAWNTKNFFWFFQFQALTQPTLGIPFLFAAVNPSPLSWLDFTGVVVSMLGIAGESLSDSQLRNYKKIDGNKGKVCNVGLWRFSRHPNYFFEWLIWCGFSILGLSAPYGITSLVSPTVMFLLLNFVTVVPPAEKQSLLSKGDLFRDYQTRTSRFFPWIPNEK